MSRINLLSSFVLSFMVMHRIEFRRASWRIRRSAPWVALRYLAATGTEHVPPLSSWRITEPSGACTRSIIGAVCCCFAWMQSRRCKADKKRICSALTGQPAATFGHAQDARGPADSTATRKSVCRVEGIRMTATRAYSGWSGAHTGFSRVDCITWRMNR